MFEIVISNYIFGLIAGNTNKSIHITNSQYEGLVNKLGKLNLIQVRELIDQTFEQLIISLEMDDQSLIDYINDYKSIFTERVISNIKHGDLKYMIITYQEEKLQDIQFLDMDNKMDNDTFRELVGKILDCKQVEDKISLITTHVSSLVDFIDILKADCLFEEEFGYVFNTLDDMELSILGKIIYGEELRYKEIKLTEMADKNFEDEWQRYYTDYINHLSNDRIAKIAYLMKTFNIKI